MLQVLSQFLVYYCDIKGVDGNSFSEGINAVFQGKNQWINAFSF